MNSLDIDFARRLDALLREEIETRTNNIAAGHAQDYAKYREMVGGLFALQALREIVHRVHDELMHGPTPTQRQMS